MLFEANIDNITSKKATFLKKNKLMLKENQESQTYYLY